LGSAVLVTGLVGAPLGAFLAATLGRWRGRDSTVTVLIIAAAAMAPFAILGPLAATDVVAFGGATVVLTFTAAAAVVAPVAIVNTAPAAMRARVSAVYLLIANLIGSGGGATVFALSTDYIFRDPSRLGESMALVSAVLLAGIIAFLSIAHR